MSYKVINGWVFTESLFKDKDSEYLEQLDIKTENVLTPFRFKLDLVECYNMSNEGDTTINIANYRITVKIPFYEFDKLIHTNY